MNCARKKTTRKRPPDREEDRGVAAETRATEVALGTWVRLAVRPERGHQHARGDGGDDSSCPAREVPRTAPEKAEDADRHEREPADVEPESGRSLGNASERERQHEPRGTLSQKIHCHASLVMAPDSGRGDREPVSERRSERPPPFRREGGAQT